MVSAGNTITTAAAPVSARLRCTPPLPAPRMAEVRRRAIFECCKWDPQVGDTAVLADFAVTLTPSQWRELAALAQTLYAETLAAEREILGRRDLLERLFLPRKIARVLQNAGAGGAGDASGAGALPPPENTFRVMRFDFHPTRDGWRVTEVNSDVPGGYIEASGFSELMRDELARAGPAPVSFGVFEKCDSVVAQATSLLECANAIDVKAGWQPALRRFALAGNPAEQIAQNLRARLPDGGRVALVHATAYTDDRQVMIFLQRILERHGFGVTLASPAEISWRDGAAFVASARGAGDASGARGARDARDAEDAEGARSAEVRDEKLDALFRFFPAEWLPNLDGGAWENFFLPAKFPRTLFINPGAAMISQTKCFPLAWSGFADGAPAAWSRLMPETRALPDALPDALRGWPASLLRALRPLRPRPAPLSDAANWLVKPSLGRVGDSIGLAGVTSEKDMAKIQKDCRRYPRRWVAQRRFESEPISTPRGPAHICIGVYVINGNACGIYGRIAPQPLINHLAQDAAVLLLQDDA